jgi:multidrug efflux pump subunit AcrA (membrane-fusion protein)
VRGRSTAVLSSKATAYIKRLAVTSGETFKAGDLLVELEATELDAASSRARASLSAALAGRGEADHGLAAAEASAKNAEATRDRIAAMVKAGSASQQMLDDAEARFRQADAARAAAAARILGAKAAIGEAQAATAGADAQLGYTRLRAPFDGRVLERRLDAGSLVAPGTPILVLQEHGRARVEVPLEASRADRVRLGDHADVSLDGRPRSEDATVVEVVPAVDVGSRSLLLKLELPPTLDETAPGAFARVAFHDGSRPVVLTPSDAVRPLGAVDRVFVAADGVAQLRIVTIGERIGDDTEIRTGLDAGERVVRAPPDLLRDGAALSFAN